MVPPPENASTSMRQAGIAPAVHRATQTSLASQAASCQTRHTHLAGLVLICALAGAEAPREWTRLWPASDGRALLAAGGAPGAPVLWLWEAAADAAQARALFRTLQLHLAAAEWSRRQVPYTCDIF